MAVESAIFRQKVPSQIFEHRPIKRHIIRRFAHFTQPLSLRNQKTSYFTTLKTFFSVFKISPYFESTTLKQGWNLTRVK